MSRIPVIPYARVSTKWQGKTGISIEDQQQVIDAFLNAHELQSRGEFSDVGSGYNEEEGSKRENYLKARRLALKYDWPIVVTVPSRFTRTPEELDRYFEEGGRLFCTELGICATNETIRAHLVIEIANDKKQQRLAAIGQKSSRAKGKFPGNPNLGPAREISLRVRKENAMRGYADFERQLEIAYAAGATTPEKIAASFNKAAFKTPRGKRWKAWNVRRVIEASGKPKAASDVASAAETMSDGYDNAKHPAVPTANVAIGSEDVIVPVKAMARSIYALSADELTEFREFLEHALLPTERFARLIRTASNPLMDQKDRATILNWMARKRAASATIELILTMPTGVVINRA